LGYYYEKKEMEEAAFGFLFEGVWHELLTNPISFILKHQRQHAQEAKQEGRRPS
jgi:hypothetical protein